MMIDNQKVVPFLSESKIKHLISKLSREIEQDYSPQIPLYCICPLKGSIFFLADFIRMLDSFKIFVDFVLIHHNKTEKSFHLLQDTALNLYNKHVLIIEGIIDSGLSLNFLKKRIQLEHPASVKSVALLHKSSHRKVLMPIDYVGQVIDDRFLLGYGMDIDEEGRGYPDIYHLRQ